MKNRYIFDVDGTLTPSRGLMDSEFRQFFLDFAQYNPCYLVTGSDYSKTLEQVGISVMYMAERVYNCSGCEVRSKGEIIRTVDWDPEYQLIKWLEAEVKDSRFYRKTGLHIEVRQGMLNFSIVGRNCSMEERHMYREWDEHKNERADIAKRFRSAFPGIVANVAGETGIDIHPEGYDKSQILQDFSEDDYIIFFGDKMQPGGNDYPLSQAIKNGRAVEVEDWQGTYNELRYKCSGD